MGQAVNGLVYVVYCGIVSWFYWGYIFYVALGLFLVEGVFLQ